MLAGLGLIGIVGYALDAGQREAATNALALQMVAFCCLLWSGGIYFLGMQKLRVFQFPALFLVFTAPIPPAIVSVIQTALQHLSVDLAFLFITLFGVPVFRSGLDFHMPGIVFRVAHECSGIRSTPVLFLAALVAGNLFLRYCEQD
jgi:exosortase